MIPLKDNIKSRSFPFVNYLFIAINTIVFIYELTLSPTNLEIFVTTYGVKPYYLVKNPISELKTLITCMFIHGGWLHFFGNMLYLYIFGDNVEGRIGHFKYCIFYFLCGISAVLIQTLFSLESKIPLIGASGAIAGVLGAYFIFFPKARILTLIFFGFFTRIIYIPAFIFLGLWFIIQLYSGSWAIFSGISSGIAWWAHIGGFIAGILIATRYF